MSDGLRLVHVTEAGTHCYEASDEWWAETMRREAEEPDAIPALVELFSRDHPELRPKDAA